MKYEILQVHLTYKGAQLIEIAVMWKSNAQGWVRGTYINNIRCGGYGFIQPEAEISEYLVNKAAGYGMNLPDDKKKEYFPGKHKWEN